MFEFPMVCNLQVREDSDNANLLRKCRVVKFSIDISIDQNSFERVAETKFIERLTLTNQ